MVASWVLYRWPIEGWVAGRVLRVCSRGGFSHVVGYASSSGPDPVTGPGPARYSVRAQPASHGPTVLWHLLVPSGCKPKGELKGDPKSFTSSPDGFVFL